MNFIDVYDSLPLAFEMQEEKGFESIFFGDTLTKMLNLTQSVMGKECSIIFNQPEVVKEKGVISVLKINTLQYIQFFFIHKSFHSHYDFLIETKIDICKAVVIISCKILKNGIPIIAFKNGPLQSLLKFALHIINVRLIGEISLRVNPLDGSFKILNASHFLRQEFLSNFSTHTFLCCLKSKIYDLISYIDERLLGKILIVINEIHYSQGYKKSKEGSSQTSNPLFRALRNSEISTFRNMDVKHSTFNKYISISHLDFPFFKKHIKQDKSDPPVKYFEMPGGKENHAIHKALHLRRKNQEIIKENIKILECYNQIAQKIQNKNLQNFTEEEIMAFRKILEVNKYKTDYKILSTLIIHKVIDEYHFANGGFTKLYRMTVVASEPNSEVQKQMVIVKKKQPNTIENGRIWWEKQVIAQLGVMSCMFINRYFNPQSPEETEEDPFDMEQCVYMQYNPEKSFNLYLSNNSKFISLSSKIFYLFQISQGLRYLRDFGIVHLDLKPENMLVRLCHFNREEYNKIIIKLIDFGESYINSNLFNPTSRGYTIPYASPEQYKQRNEFNEKSDVFSLGIIMFHIFFDFGSLDLKHAGPAVFRDSSDYIKYYTYCHEKCGFYGPDFIAKSLLRLAFKCIDPDQRKRPLLDWVAILLKDLSSYKDNMYYQMEEF